MRVDVDALMAAEAEHGRTRDQQPEGGELTFRGIVFVLPPKVDVLGISEAYETSGPESAARLFRCFLGEEQYGVLRGLKPDDVEIRLLLRSCARMYGMVGEEPGESQASGVSSTNGGESSRPTSSVSTESTSDGESSAAPV